MITETSRESYKKLVESGELTNKQVAAYGYILAHGPCPATDLPDNGWKRVSELAEMGLIECIGTEYRPQTKRRVMVWLASENPATGKPRAKKKEIAKESQKQISDLYDVAYRLGYEAGATGKPYEGPIEVIDCSVNAMVMRVRK